MKVALRQSCGAVRGRERQIRAYEIKKKKNCVAKDRLRNQSQEMTK